ncbi:MAG: L,D-transpeptidase [Acidobacteriia bacterium]|nr:L,D-transpeptidase [Terriglobia bacterium]
MRRATRKSEGQANGKMRQVLAAAAVMLMAAARAQAQSAAPPPEAQPGTSATQTPAASVVVRKILVSLPERKLAVVEDGKVVKIYRVAVGKRSTPSPVGEFQVINRVAGPSYYQPGLVVPAGPENPLGTHWIGIDSKKIGIHGTNQPRSIGRRASHGCIRMKNEDVAELFARVRVGDAVEILAEHTTETAQIFGAAAPAVLTAQAAPAAQTKLTEAPRETAAAAQ